MLKFTNTTRTAAQFKDAFFSLDAADNWQSIGDGPTRTAVLAWLDAGNTPEPADVAPPPSPLEQIRALEQAHDDDQRKLNRQAAIDTALTIVCRSPQAAGKTRAEVHTLWYIANRGYRAMVDLEAAVEHLRKQIK